MLKKITIVKKKYIFKKFVKLIFAKFCKAIAFKSNIKKFTNTRNFIFVNKILQVYIFLIFLLLISTINFVLFKTINLITIACFI